MVTHVLKDGSVKQDITGHVVKKEDAPKFYDLIERVRKEKNERRS
jgi:hypothetical protein